MYTYEERDPLVIAILICPLSVWAPWELCDANAGKSVRGNEFSMYSKNVFSHSNDKMQQTSTMKGSNKFLMSLSETEKLSPICILFRYLLYKNGLGGKYVFK